MLDCEFELDHVNAVYYSGEEIKGRIILTTQKNIMLNAVFVCLEGKAICKWYDSDPDEPTIYDDYQKLLRYRNKVFDGPSYFPAGEHVYEISMPIPDICPSTCKGRYGYISYEISIKLGRNKMFDKVFRKQIIVYQTFDLNDNPRNKLPAENEFTKYLCLWPCQSGPILTNIAIPFSGYIPEQSITLSVNVDNQSKYEITGIEVSLNQHFTHCVRKPKSSKSSTKTLVNTVISKSTLSLSNQMYAASVVVPPDTQRTSIPENCLISLHYELQVKLKTGLFHKDIVMRVPIVIGTVPFERVHGDNTLVTMQPTTSNAPNTSSQQTFNGSQSDTNERQRIINLPQFPWYNTFAGMWNEYQQGRAREK